MGTSGALNRIDRKTGQYTAYRSAGPGFNTDVTAIVEDGSGTLWVGTYGHGLKRFDRRTGQFQSLRDNPADASSSIRLSSAVQRSRRCGVGLDLE